MALKSRVFKHFNLERNEEGNIKFAPSKLNGEELYSVINSKDEFCGYVTPGFLESIIVNDNGVERLRKGFQVNSFGQRDGKFIIRNIVLEKPNKECSDFEYSVVLRPIDTSKIDPTLETLTIIANKKFSIDNGNTTLDLKFNDHIVEADNFNIKLYGSAWTTTLDIELAKNRARDIIIDGLRPRDQSYTNQDLYFKLKSTNKNVPVDIEISNFSLSLEKDEQGNLIYPHFETGRNFIVHNSVVKIPSTYKPIKGPYKIVSTDGDIILKYDSTIRFDYSNSSGSSITAKDSIKLNNTEMTVDGKSTINGSIEVDMKERQYYRSIMIFQNTSSNSDIAFTPLTKDKKKAVFKESKLDNGDNPISLKGEVWLEGVNLENNRGKELLLRNAHVSYSNLANVGDLTEFSITNAHLENFNFNNKSKQKDSAFYCYTIGLPIEDKTIHSSFKNVDISLGNGEKFLSTTGPLNFSNVVIKGAMSLVTTDDNKKSSPVPVAMNNVALTNATITLLRDIADIKKEIVINTSELVERVILSDCDKVEGSFIKNSELQGFKEIKNSIIEKQKMTAKSIDKIIDCGSEDLDNLEKGSIKVVATNELEIL